MLPTPLSLGPRDGFPRTPPRKTRPSHQDHARSHLYRHPHPGNALIQVSNVLPSFSLLRIPYTLSAGTPRVPRHERLVVTYILPGIRHNPPYPTHFFGGRRRLTQASSPDNVPHNAPLSTPLEPESLPICICWDHSSVFSQWYPSTFTADIEHYNCAEQYMMLEKVKCFVDTATRLKIMSSPNSAQPKRLGRSVSNFNQGIWVQHRYDIVLKGNLAKFSAPPILEQFVRRHRR